MENNYKRKYLTVVIFGFLTIFGLINWYGTIDREQVEMISKREYLSFDEARETAKDHKPERKYYYQIEYTELTQKSVIPFVYNTKPITQVKKVLMSQPH